MILFTVISSYFLLPGCWLHPTEFASNISVDGAWLASCIPFTKVQQNGTRDEYSMDTL